MDLNAAIAPLDEDENGDDAAELRRDLDEVGRQYAALTGLGEELRFRDGAGALEEAVASALVDGVAEAMVGKAVEAERLVMRLVEQEPDGGMLLPRAMRLRSAVANEAKAVRDVASFLSRRPTAEMDALILDELHEEARSCSRFARPFVESARRACAEAVAAALQAWVSRGVVTDKRLLPFVVDAGERRAFIVHLRARSSKVAVKVVELTDPPFLGTRFRLAVDRVPLSHMSSETALDLVAAGALAAWFPSAAPPTQELEFDAAVQGGDALRFAASRVRSSAARKLAEAVDWPAFSRVVRAGFLLGDSDVSSSALECWAWARDAQARRVSPEPVLKHDMLRFEARARGGATDLAKEPGVLLVAGHVSSPSDEAVVCVASGSLRLARKFRAEDAFRVLVRGVRLHRAGGKLTVCVFPDTLRGSRAGLRLDVEADGLRLWLGDEPVASVAFRRETEGEVDAGGGGEDNPDDDVRFVVDVDPSTGHRRARAFTSRTAHDPAAALEHAFPLISGFECPWADAFGFAWVAVEATNAVMRVDGLGVDVSRGDVVPALAWSSSAFFAGSVPRGLSALCPVDLVEDLQGPFGFLLEIKRVARDLTSAWVERLRGGRGQRDRERDRERERESEREAETDVETTEAWRTRAAMSYFCNAVEMYLQTSVVDVELRRFGAAVDGLDGAAVVARIVDRCALGNATTRRALDVALARCRAFATNESIESDADARALAPFASAVRGFLASVRRASRVSSPSASADVDALAGLLVQLDFSGFYDGNRVTV